METKNTAKSSTQVLGELESVVLATQQIEVSLQHERAKSARLERTLIDTKANYDRLLSEAKAVHEQNRVQLEKFRNVAKEAQEQERSMALKQSETLAELKRAESELQHYKKAWGEVLQREKEAKLVIAENEDLKQRIQIIENRKQGLEEALRSELRRREEAEKQIEAGREELQKALVRAHTSEARYQNFTREMAIFTATQKTIEQRLAKIEANLQKPKEAALSVVQFADDPDLFAGSKINQ